MLSLIRGRLTYANVAVTAALVFAMAGGALAATGGGHAATARHKKSRAAGYVIKSIKQIKPQVLKQLKGNVGPEGKQGSAGPEGKPGAAGKAGTNGTNGVNGLSVVAAAFTGAKGSCAEGGAEFTVGTASPTYACNGAAGGAGTPGESVSSAEFTGEKGTCKYGGAEFTIGTGTTTYACNGKSAGEVLAAGATEIGAWTVEISSTKIETNKTTKEERYIGSTAISYPLPLPEGSKVKVHYVTTVQASEKSVPECPSQHEALPGNLCLYEVHAYAGSGFAFVGQVGASAGETGTVVMFDNPTTEGAEGLVFGSWALTAE